MAEGMEASGAYLACRQASKGTSKFPWEGEGVRGMKGENIL